MNPSIIIEQVAVTDIRLINLVDELNTFFMDEWGEEVNDSYSNHHQLDSMKEAYIALFNEIPIGCACWKERSDGKPEIKRMYVKSDYRGTNTAKELLKTVEKSILSRGFNSVVLETGKDMLQAIRFYEKQGYEVIPNFGEFVDDDLCICLEKKLIKNH